MTWHWHCRCPRSTSSCIEAWDRNRDQLVLGISKEKIEGGLYHRLRDLFGFKPELVLYDRRQHATSGPASNGDGRRHARPQISRRAGHLCVQEGFGSPFGEWSRAVPNRITSEQD